MADGVLNPTLTVTLDDETARRLADAARQAGLAPEAYVATLVERGLGASPDAMAYEWAAAERAFADYDRTGQSVDAKQALDAFVETVKLQASLRS